MHQKKFQPIVEKINLEYKKIQSLSNDDLRKKTSSFNMKLLESFRREIPFVKQDCIMKELISNSEKFLNKFDIDFSYFL